MRDPARRAGFPVLAVAFLVALVLGVAPIVVLAGDEVTVDENVTYGKGGDVDLKLDIARPAGEGPFPAIVFIHGGGWGAGDRHHYGHEIREAAQHGYAAATVSYRLTNEEVDGKPKYRFPAMVNDVKCAIRWVRANAAKYHIDPDHIGASGGSAGGHLSLMVGLADSSAGLEGDGGNPDQSSRVHAVVNFFGPTEMLSAHKTSQGGPPILERFLGGKPDEVPDAYKASSPLTYVTSDDPPVLTFHGDQDFLVPLDQAVQLDTKMKEVGASHTLVIMKGYAHGWKDDALEVTRGGMYAFFDRHLKGKQ